MPPLLASQPLGSSFQVTGRAETKEQKSPDESGFYWNAHCSAHSSFNMAVAALKKIVEGESNYDDSCSPSEVLLEIFCVDASISMSRSQHFPYIFGESKLQLCKRIIDRGFALPAHAVLHTALVKFNASAVLAVPFGPHTPEHSAQIKTELESTEHQKGSVIFSAYAFCEKLVSDYQAELDVPGIEFIHLLHCSDLPILRVLLPSPAAKYENSAKVLIHLFTDGMDNGSSPEDVAKYQGSVALESQGTNAGAAKGEESLRQSFLYSLDTAFAESSALAKSLQAHLVVINDTDIAAALEDRDKWVLKFLAQRKVAKARAGYALAKGYTPDLASVYKVLQKVYRYFSGSGLAFLEKEGLFRVNGNVNDSKRLANQLLTNSEFLNDFEDSILVAHSLKTALATSPPILPPSFQHILVEVSKHVKTGRNKAISSSTATEPRSSAGGSAGDASSSAAPSANESATMEETTPANRTALNASKNSSHRPQVERPEDPERLAEQNFVLELAKTKIFELPHLNLQCLHILLYLLNLVASQEHTNKMGAANLSTIFTFLLFPELLVPNPGLQELISILVMRVNDVFPHPPQLKVSANRSMSQGNELELPAAPKNVIMPVASSSSSNTAVVAPAPPSLAEEKPRVIKKAVSLSATTHDLLSRPSAELSPPKLQVPESKSNNPTPLSSPRLEGAPAIDSLSSDFSRAVNPMPPSSSSSSSIGPLAHSVSSTLPSTQSSTSTIAQSSTQGAQTSTSPVVSPITSPSTSTTTSPTLKRHASVRPTRDPPPVPTTSSTTTTSPPTLSPTVSKSSLSVAPTNPLPPVPTAPASPPPTPLTE